MYFYKKANKYLFLKKKNIFSTNKNNLIFYKQRYNLNWVSFKFYITKVNKTASPWLKNHIKYKRLHLNKNEISAFNLLVNNFCSNGNFLKYYNMFLNVLNQLNKHFFSNTIINKLSQKGLNNLNVFFKFLKSDIFLTLPTNLIYFLFSKNELLFFAKVVKLSRRAAKKKKKKFFLKFTYAIPKKRFSKIIKFWKYCINAVSHKFLKKKIFNGLLQLIVNYKNSVLLKYRKKALKKLIRTKKIEI